MWTTRVPDKDGHYWWRNGEDAVPQVVRLINGRLAFHGILGRRTAEEVGGEWQGPILYVITEK